MRLSFQNLGILDSAEIELGDLTIICGKNNTGKTYATYALYGLLRSWRRLVADMLGQLLPLSFDVNGTAELDLNSLILEKWEDHLVKLAGMYRDILPAALAADSERFKETVIKIDFPKPADLASRSFEHVTRLPNEKPLLSINKPAGSLRLIATLLEKPQELPSGALSEIIASALLDLCFGHALPNVFMASTERTGAAIFKNELNFTQRRLIEAIANLKDTKAINPRNLLSIIIPEFNSRYAFPVRDEVEFVNQVETLENDESPLLKENPSLLDAFHDLLGGEYRVVRKVVYFVPEGTRGLRLALGESSSAVRSLLDIGFYLRHRARKGDLFMIDEPELNLHPANQRKMARLIAQLVNAGLKVFLTTHSDFLAKEINTLLLLGRAGADYAQKHGYKASELLSADRLRLYIAKEQTGRRNADAKRATTIQTLCRVEPFEDGGFDFPSFDDTIVEMNKLQRDIWDHLNESRP